VSATGLRRSEDGALRCWWPGADPLYVRYHDEEWGFPVDDDRRLFEKVCLEGFQAGLSWLTILRKRENFRKAFANFDLARVARFDARAVRRLLEDAGIVRHRGKIESTINNARRALALREEKGSLAAYFWQWAPPPADRPRRDDHLRVHAGDGPGERPPRRMCRAGARAGRGAEVPAAVLISARGLLPRAPSGADHGRS